MIPAPARPQVWLAAGVTDMRKGFGGLSLLVQDHLQKNPFSGQLFIFRGRKGNLIKCLYWDGTGLCLFAKRLEGAKFVWPSAWTTGAVSLTPGQVALLLEGIDWRLTRARRFDAAGEERRPPELAG